MKIILEAQMDSQNMKVPYNNDTESSEEAKNDDAPDKIKIAILKS